MKLLPWMVLVVAACAPSAEVTRGTGPAPAQQQVAPTSPAPASAKADQALKRTPLQPAHFEGRDPFRAEPLVAPPVRGDAEVKMAAYGCSEVRLSAVVTAGLNPHAMFLDPRGLGYTVQVGDRICSDAEKVLRITGNAVVVEASEELGRGVRPVQRRIAIAHPELALVDPLSLR